MEGCRARCSGSAITFALGGGPSQVMLFLVPLPLDFSVISLDHFHNSYKIIYARTASESSDPEPSGKNFCDSDVGELNEMGVSSGLSHADKEHIRSSSGSATDCTTPRKLSLRINLKIRPAYIDCLDHEIRLDVAKARGHQLVRVSLVGGAMRRM